MIRFTFRQLEIFIAVAQHLNMSKAARALHLTQPAVSQQLHKLETLLNNSLFEQLGKNIYLTETGKFLLAHAKNIIESAELFMNTCISENMIVNGKLRVGVGIPLQTMFFNVLNKFNQQYSFVNVECKDGDRNKQLKYLRDNKVDFCLLVHPVKSIDLISERINELPMTFIVSPQHRLAYKKNVISQKLSDETFIVTEEGSANYVKIYELFQKLKNKPKVIQIKDQNAVKNAVMANLGLSILPKHMLQIELMHKLLFPLIIDDYPNPTTEAYWVQHIDKKLSSITQLFKTFLLNELKNINSVHLQIHDKVAC